MENNIKNFIEEGEKEFEKQFGGEGVIARTDENSILIGFTKREVKEFWNSRQISLIKMIMEEAKDITPDIGILAACNISSEANHYVNGFNKALDTISSKLSSLVNGEK